MSNMWRPPGVLMHFRCVCVPVRACVRAGAMCASIFLVPCSSFGVCRCDWPGDLAASARILGILNIVHNRLERKGCLVSFVVSSTVIRGVRAGCLSNLVTYLCAPEQTPEPKARARSFGKLRNNLHGGGGDGTQWPGRACRHGARREQILFATTAAAGERAGEPGECQSSNGRVAGGWRRHARARPHSIKGAAHTLAHVFAQKCFLYCARERRETRCGRRATTTTTLALGHASA